MSAFAPSTATVLEFRCLFTHDLRRKQKRWQDGRLKYHSFNSRVMVYDERGNSVGDMHWHGDYDFGEGEEVQLERGGVIVQVEDLVERRETDLSELVDKRLQEKQQRQIQQLARSVAPSAVLPRSLPRPAAVAPDRLQPRHRPLHHIIGTPTGHHGKAFAPKESPFEQRHQAAESPDDRAAKRRRFDDPPPSKSGFAAALFGQSLTLSATPSSSVSAIRRPRPGPSSDPPDEVDTRRIREEPKPARREQPQPSRRLTQPSYAQSLFGQTLTLSHTPASSVPSRPRARNESESSPTIDEDEGDFHQAPRPPLQEQPTNPHIEESGGKPRSALLSKQSNGSKGMAKGSAEVQISDGHASMSRRYHSTNTVQKSPAEIDIIEIDGPDPVAPSPVGQPRPEKRTAAAARKQGGHIDRSNVLSGQKAAHQEDSVRPTNKQSLEHEQESQRMKGKVHEKSKKAELAGAKATARKSSSEQIPSAAQQKATRVPDAAKKPEVPVTELRIKSSKKRGLLMISDASKPRKTRRPAAAKSARSFENSSHQSKDVDDYDPFRSPSPGSASKERNKFAESTRSTATVSKPMLNTGENDDNYLDPTLDLDGGWENEDVMGELEKKSMLRKISTELGEDDDPFRSQSSAILQQADARPNVQDRSTTVFSRNDVEQEAADADHSMRHSSTPPRAGYDPYRIPSSPPAFSPTSPPSGVKKGHRHGADDNILRPVDRNKKLSKAKQQRHSRRKVVSDEDDDDDAEPLGSLPKKPHTGSGAEQAVVSRLNGAASKKQPKSGKVTSRKVNAQEDVAMIQSSDDQSDKAARKARAQNEEMSVESEDEEQPIKRRKSTRQRRSRAVSYEEPSPLPSDHNGSMEEEEAPRKRQRTKTSKASEDRPHLERIKKNVKSRELVGFNLAALNAPLGLRGIGMPFSILSSPANESIQRRVSDHAAVEEASNLAANDGDDGRMSPPTRIPAAALLATNAEAKQNSPAAESSKETPDCVTLADPEYHSLKRNTESEVHSSGLDGVSPSHLAQEESANTESPRNNANSAPAEPTLPSLNQPEQHSLAIPRQSSTCVKNVTAQDTTPEVAGETATNAEPSLVPAPVPAPVTKSATSTGRSVIGDRTDATIEELDSTDGISADLSAIPTPRPRLGVSLKQQKPGFPGHSSETRSNHVQRSSTKDPSKTSESNQTAPTRSSNALQPSKEPAPALLRQSSTNGEQSSVGAEQVVENPDSVPTPALPVQQLKPIGLRRQVSTPRRINNLGTKPAPQAEATESSTETNAKPASNARIANPASRGRKAALASHAAGQAPQRVLPPTQPSLILPISTADLAMTPIEEPAKEPERPKKTMKFPGFQSARSDGPWSREAFDLLESGRPE
ncbi:hypothetical protein diail_1323 [Diaporthe ilicicola]|nr:hypothetical protein diail_1323 [Diaporthe ilicicola]